MRNFVKLTAATVLIVSSSVQAGAIIALSGYLAGTFKDNLPTAGFVFSTNLTKTEDWPITRIAPFAISLQSIPSDFAPKLDMGLGNPTAGASPWDNVSNPSAIQPVEANLGTGKLGAEGSVSPVSPVSRGGEVEGERRRVKVTPAMIPAIEFDRPMLAPFAHTRFCLKYPSECRVRRTVFRGGAIDLTTERRRELFQVNLMVNRNIKPTRLDEPPATEQWLISPKSGDCNDYAVTKRHELLARGWPARSLLLAEVVTSWGEHHLVLVIRTRQGDLVIDNLNANIRPWQKTGYQWVRMQKGNNPHLWATIKAPATSAVAMMDRGQRL